VLRTKRQLNLKANKKGRTEDRKMGWLSRKEKVQTIKSRVEESTEEQKSGWQTPTELKEGADKNREQHKNARIHKIEGA